MGKKNEGPLKSGARMFRIKMTPNGNLRVGVRRIRDTSKARIQMQRPLLGKTFFHIKSQECSLSLGEEKRKVERRIKREMRWLKEQVRIRSKALRILNELPEDIGDSNREFRITSEDENKIC